MKFREISKADDAILAGIIRSNLKAYKLDIPGTVYFDNNLDHLSDYYLGDRAKRYYFIAVEDDEVIGGIGLAEFEFFDDCAELQKLYLADRAKGRGIGYTLIRMVEDKARELGYKRIYLETHNNLTPAIHIYEKSGYREIEKPAGVVHATMDRFFIKEL
jgi:putative acetyltransferase